MLAILLQCNKLRNPQKGKQKTKNMTVLRSKHFLAHSFLRSGIQGGLMEWFLLRFVHEVIIKLLTVLYSFQEVLIGKEEFASMFTRGSWQASVHPWLLAEDSICSPYRPLHRAAGNMAACLSK